MKPKRRGHPMTQYSGTPVSTSSLILSGPLWKYVRSVLKPKKDYPSQSLPTLLCPWEIPDHDKCSHGGQRSDSETALSSVRDWGRYQSWAQQKNARSIPACSPTGALRATAWLTLPGWSKTATPRLRGHFWEHNYEIIPETRDETARMLICLAGLF